VLVHSIVSKADVKRHDELISSHWLQYDVGQLHKLNYSLAIIVV